MSNLIIPSSKTGFAIYPEESRAPELRRKLGGAWLPFWGITDLELLDFSGQERHCGLAGGLVAATAWVPSKMGWALNFNGTSNYVGRSERIFTAFPFTFEAWVKYDGQYGMAVSVCDPGLMYRYYCISIDASGCPELWARNPSGEGITSPDSIADGRFHQIVGVFESATMRRLYVDGVLKGTDTVSVAYHDNIYNFLIGMLRLTPLAGWWKGDISSVKIFPYALSGSEIAYLHSEPFAMWQLAESVSVKYVGGVVDMTATAAIATATTASLSLGVTESMTATAAIATATSASLTKHGIVDMSATAAIATATTASLTKWGTVLMTATAAISTAATGTLGLGVTESMTATAAISTAATGTLWIKGEFFIDIPIPTISELGSIAGSESYANTIPIQTLSIDSSTGEIKIEENSIPIPTLSNDAERVIPRMNPGGVLLYDTGVYTDFTTEARSNTPDDVDLSDGAGTILYIGYKEKFYAVKILVSTAGVGSYTIQAPKYWNGAAWVNLQFSTGEQNHFKTAETIHIGGFPEEPDDWAKTTVDGTELYWISMETLAGTQSQKPMAQRIYLKIVGVTSFRFLTFASDESYQEFF